MISALCYLISTKRISRQISLEKITSSLLPALGSNGNSELPGRSSVSVVHQEKMFGRIHVETKVLPLPSAQKPRQAGERGRRSQGKKKELGSFRTSDLAQSTNSMQKMVKRLELRGLNAK